MFFARFGRESGIVLLIQYLRRDRSFDAFPVQDAAQFLRGLAGRRGMRLVDDNGEAPTGGVDCNRIALLGHRVDGLRYEGELLDRRNHDWHAARQRLGKLLRILVDLLDDAFLVLELVDRVLQLPVKNEPVGDHDDRVEHLLVLRVVKPGEMMREPRDGVRFA